MALILSDGRYHLPVNEASCSGYKALCLVLLSLMLLLFFPQASEASSACLFPDALARVALLIPAAWASVTHWLLGLHVQQPLPLPLALQISVSLQ